MKLENKYGLNNPIPYIFSVFVLSSLTYEMFNRNKQLAILIVSCFFIWLYFYKKIIFTAIMLSFFIVAIFNLNNYFNYVPQSIVEVRIEKVSFSGVTGKINGRKVELEIKDSKIKEGDRILATGEYTKDLKITKGITGKYKVHSFKLMEGDLVKRLYHRRSEIYNNISEKIGSRKAGLITSVAFGYSSTLDGEDREAMKDLGLSHAVSVSGLHLALVYGVLSKIIGTNLAICLTFFYVLFTGAPTSSVRAYIMILVTNLALVLKRNYNSTSSLSLSGIIILLIKPYDIFSLGFILSFLATLGIVLYNKKINKALYRLPNFIRNTFSLSLSAQIFTFPVLILSFNEFSLNFLLANLLILPLINILVILGVLMIFVFKIDIIFNYLLFLSHYCIKAIDRLQDFLVRINFEEVYLNYYIAYFYIGLLISYYFYKKNYKEFIYFPIIVFIYISVLIYNPVPNIRYYKDGGLLISYKGERVLVQTKSVVDKEKLKSVANVDEILKDIGTIRVGSNITLRKSGKNFKVSVGNSHYLIKVNYEKSSEECDIIDFINGEFQEVWIVNDNIIANE